MYHVYLMMITKSIALTDKYTIYEYVNYGTLSYYYRILKDITTKIENSNQSMEIIYMKKYHYNTIYILKTFLDRLIIRIRKDAYYQCVLNKILADYGYPKNLDPTKLPDTDPIKKNIYDEFNIALQNEDTKTLVSKPLDDPTMVYLKPVFDEIKINSSAINKIVLAEKKIINVLGSGTHQEIKSMFFLFSHFSNILDTYQNLYQGKVTIYSRINDKSEIVYSGHRIFDMEPLEFNKLYINSAECGARWIDTAAKDRVLQTLYDGLETKDAKKMLVFNEVLDTKTTPDSASLSKYMLIATRLKMEKSIMLITYGYSGTGKSYTMFGSATSGGILQSTLEEVDATEINLRIFELYGLGVAFDYYWKKSVSDLTSQVIYAYPLSIKDKKLATGEPIPYSSTEIKRYMDSDKDTPGNIFLKISNPEDIKGSLQYFKDFSDKIDGFRKRDKRVRETPNNPESSRSILVYEFVIKLPNGVYVSFVIIDLPGREELMESYAIPSINFMEKIGMRFDEKLVKFVLSTTILNPISMSMVYPNIIIEQVLKSSNKSRIFNHNLSTYAVINNAYNLKDPWNDFETKFRTRNRGKYNINFDENKIEQTDVTFLEEIIYADVQYKCIYTVGDILTINGEIFEFKPTQEFMELSIKREESDILIHILLAISLLYRIIELNDFDLLDKIATNIVNKLFGDNLINTLKNKPDDADLILDAIRSSRPLFLESYIKKIKNEDKVNELIELKGSIMKWTNDVIRSLLSTTVDNKLTPIRIKELSLAYSYTKTPYEGIYINENIMALLLYLLTEPGEKAKADIVGTGKSINKQNVSELTLEKQRNNCLNNILLGYSITSDSDSVLIGYNQPSSLHFDYSKCRIDSNNITWSDIYIDTARLVSITNTTVDTYKSDYIFKDENTPIENMFRPYFRGRTPINDYKLFYLMNNDPPKCGAQLKLLLKTSKIIEEFNK
jgi:hypothetical protein